jgi:putative endonuclease
MCYVYLLESLKDGDWYTGYTTNLKDRFLRHNSGKVASTKNRRPFKLIYYECYANRLDAKKREKFLKSGSGKNFLRKQLYNYLKSKQFLDDQESTIK